VPHGANDRPSLPVAIFPPTPEPRRDDRWVSHDAGTFRFSLDDIRGQTAWCKRLAGALVRQEGVGADAADDAVQELWLAGLSHPPAHGEGIRAWLRVVLANVVRKQRRGDNRRRAREQTVALAAQVMTPAAPDTLELALRLEAQRLVADLALALDEPLRSTLLLRYYEDFSPAQIAARQGVPAGTVRWRLKQARDQLRAQLEAHHAGPRPWRALLLPLAPPAGVGAGARDLGIWKGMLAMKAGTKLGTLAVVLLLALFVGVTGWRAAGGGSVDPEPETATTNVAVARPAAHAMSPTATGPAARTTASASVSVPRPRVYVPRFVAAPGVRLDDARDPLLAGGGRLLAVDHGHITNRMPDGGGVHPAQVARVEDNLDLMHDRANQCLAGWQRLDPALAKGIMLGVEFDADGLEDVFVDGESTIPDGPLRCLSNAVYELDWAGLTSPSMRRALVTLPLSYESTDAGSPP
jgi:RNA polymerase sigma factor (sigma-70 family)